VGRPLAAYAMRPVGAAIFRDHLAPAAAAPCSQRARFVAAAAAVLPAGLRTPLIPIANSRPSRSEGSSPEIGRPARGRSDIAAAVGAGP